MKSFIGLAVLTIAVLLFIKAIEYKPVTNRHVGAPDMSSVSAEPLSHEIVLPPVVITAHAIRKTPPVRQVAPCAFTNRPLTQGLGSVRGFCM
jgi:hypothetical protein